MPLFPGTFGVNETATVGVCVKITHCVRIQFYYFLCRNIAKTNFVCGFKSLSRSFYTEILNGY